MLKISARRLTLQRGTLLSRRWNSVKVLQQAFQDPSSPYYLAPGEAGPSEDALWPAGDSPFSEATKVNKTLEQVLAREAETFARSNGYDPLSFWEQKIVWGDLDSFKHLNNVRYVRFIESGRMKYFAELGRRVSPEVSNDMMAGRGRSIILKSININFKRPVTYPDTLLISHRLHDLQPTRFKLSTSLYSYTQQREVALSDSVCVWYDYDTLSKCEAPEEVATLLRDRVKICDLTVAESKA